NEFGEAKLSPWFAILEARPTQGASMARTNLRCLIGPDRRAQVFHFPTFVPSNTSGETEPCPGAVVRASSAPDDDSPNPPIARRPDASNGCRWPEAVLRPTARHRHRLWVQPRPGPGSCPGCGPTCRDGHDRGP